MFKKTEMDKEYIITNIGKQAVYYRANAKRYEILSTTGEKELKYHYMHLWMEYYKLFLEMESIQAKFGCKPSFD